MKYTHCYSTRNTPYSTMGRKMQMIESISKASNKLQIVGRKLSKSSNTKLKLERLFS